MVTKEQIISWLRLTAQVMQDNKEWLTQLDAAIGDGEHGINMARGFQKVSNQLPEVADKDIGSILKSTGMTLLSAIGGAGGSIFATFFIEAGKETSGKQELGPADMAAFLRAGLSGVIKRGGAQVGDKTMVDSLAPAVAAFDRSLEEGTDTAEALGQAVAAAQNGVTETTHLVARKGRASYLGERSIGHQDPGATSLYLILKALSDAVSQKESADS
ncbi:MAG: dihydroxyacetone kinase subunit DhaL [Dehalococcoidia bacterium]|jgi:dihydroxyacetone kinase-like protein